MASTEMNKTKSTSYNINKLFNDLIRDYILRLLQEEDDISTTDLLALVNAFAKYIQIQETAGYTQFNQESFEVEIFKEKQKQNQELQDEFEESLAKLFSEEDFKDRFHETVEFLSTIKIPGSEVAEMEKHFEDLFFKLLTSK